MTPGTVAAIVGKLVLCYLAAGAAFVLFTSWPDYAGHPHVPFSGFPGMLAFSPMAPYLMLLEFEERGASGAIAGVLVFVAMFAAVAWLSFRRSAR